MWFNLFGSKEKLSNEEKYLRLAKTIADCKENADTLKRQLKEMKFSIN